MKAHGAGRHTASLRINGLHFDWTLIITMESQAIGYRAFSAMGILWLAAAYLAGQYVAVLPFGFLVVSVFVFAVPIAISGAYSSAVNQTRIMSYYKISGWFYRLFSGRLVRSVFWLLWALASSFLMLLQFSTYSILEWVTLALAIPTFWYIHKFCHSVFSSELKKLYVIYSFAIEWTRLICPIFLVIIYVILIKIFSSDPSYTSLAESVAAIRVNTPEVAPSSVVQVALFYISFANGTKAYLGDNLKSYWEYAPILMLIVGSYVVFFNASATFASFSIPRSEFRRIFAPISDDALPPTLTRTRITTASAIITVVTLFIYVPVFADLEDIARSNPGFITLLKNAQLKVEKIDNEFYRPGTMRAIELEKASSLGKVNASRAILEGQIDQAFIQIESKVDNYLDWYYSLSGEYMRLANLMSGEIEKYMEEKLVEKLNQEEALKPVIAGLEVALANHRVITDEYQQAVNKIMESNRIDVPEFGAGRIPGITSDQILALPTHFDLISMRSRVVGGSAAAGIGVAIVAKIASKGIFKAAGKALSKIAISKAAGTAGGAAVGALIGSVVPGAGTVIGGVIGGALAGVIIDKVLLKLEEEISRENFRNEILNSIRESRDKFKSELFITPPSTSSQP